jgi:hypothetical protein
VVNDIVARLQLKIQRPQFFPGRRINRVANYREMTVCRTRQRHRLEKQISTEVTSDHFERSEIAIPMWGDERVSISQWIRKEECNANLRSQTMTLPRAS